MKLNSYSNWFYFNGEKFREITEIGKKTDKEYEVPDDKIAGKIVFEGLRSRTGGIGGIYMATSKELIRLGEPPDNRKFIDLFYPLIISHQGRDGLFRLLDWEKAIEGLIPYQVERCWYTRAVEEALKTPSRYLSRLLSYKESGSRIRSIQQVTKLLHQIFVSLKIVDLWYGSEVIDRRLDFEQRKEMKSGIKRVDFMMPVSWGRPTFRIRHDDDTYSIWHEFSAPYPLSLKEAKEKIESRKPLREIYSALSSDTRRRFDIIVQEGDIDSMFFEKPERAEKIDSVWPCEEAGESQEKLLEIPRKYFKKMRRVDLLIECKEQRFKEWESDVDNQIIPYKKVYNPREMVLISAYEDVTELAKSRLEEEGIKVVAPFRPDEVPYKQERKLRESLEAI